MKNEEIGRSQFFIRNSKFEILLLSPLYLLHHGDDVALERRPAEFALDLENPAVQQLVQNGVHDEALILGSRRDEVVEQLIEIDAALVDHVHAAEVRQRV